MADSVAIPDGWEVDSDLPEGWEEVRGDDFIALSNPKKVEAYTKYAEVLSRTPPLGLGEQAAAAKIPAQDRPLVKELVRRQYATDQSMKEAGYGARLITSAVQGAIDFGTPLAKLASKATGLVPEAQQLEPDAERFKQELIAIREEVDPTIRPDTNVIGRGVQQASRMAFPMMMSVGAGRLAGGTAALAGAGQVGVTAATALGTSGSFLPQTADQTYTSLIAEGVPPDRAATITAVSAPIEAAIESILPDPFKGSSGLFRGTARQVAANLVKQYTRNYVKELGEEGLQGIVNETAMEVGRMLDETIPNKGIGSILMRGVTDMQESALPLALMMAPGAAVQSAGVAAESAARPGRLEELRAARAKGYIPQAEGKKLGLSGTTRQERLAEVDAKIQQLEQEAKDAGTIRGPETEVRQEQGGPDIRGQGQVEVPAEPAGEVAPARPEVQPVEEVSPMGDVSEAPEVGAGAPPKSGLVVAAIGADGKIYYGGPGQLHADLMRHESVAEGMSTNQSNDPNMGFADATGRFLTREEAAAESGVQVPEDQIGKLDATQVPQQAPEAAPEAQAVPEAVPQPETLPAAAQEPKPAPKRGRKPKTPKEPETLLHAVQSLGGLSSDKISRGSRINIREDLKEFGLLGAMQNKLKKGTKGALDLEEMALELESGGYWRAPEGANKGDALLQAIKEGALTFAGMEKQTEREYAAYQAEYDQEASHAKEQGTEAEGLLQDGLRAGAKDGLSEAEATEGEAAEVLGEVDLSFNFGANVPQGVSGEQQALFQKEDQGQLFNVSKPKGKAERGKPQRSDLEKIEDEQKAAHKESLAGQKEFGRDVAGVLGATAVPISGHQGEVGRSVRHFFQRFFTSRGELPQEVYDSKVGKEGRVAKEMAHLRFVATDFRRGIQKALGGKELTQADVEKMNSVLRGEADETTVPQEVREPLRAMRDHIDSLSRATIAEGVAQGDLVGIITENMGVYATRSYRVFDDPKWREKVPEGVRNRALAETRNMYPDKSDADIQGIVESLLFRGAADSPSALLKGSKLGSKDLSTFMKRQDVPQWLRDLWGEYKDAGVNYARSVFKMSHLLANHQFLNEVRDSGSGKWLRSKEDGPTVNEWGEVVAKIAADGSSVMEPLNGMYTTPEIKKAFERLDSPGAMPEWLRVMMAVNYAVKYSKTVGSMMTHVRNLISNTGFAVANGHWRLGKSGKALWATTTGTFSLPDAEFRSYYERAAELGLVGEDVRAGELKDALRDASEADIDEFLYNAQARQAKRIVRSGKSGFRFLNSLYQAEDGVWKLYAWENEKARYAKAHPEWSQEQVEQRAAEIVRDTYPTYSKIPEAIKGLRRFPLVGTFVSFPSEVVRTTFHAIEIGLEEMKAPETRAIGAQRLAGTVVAVGGLSVLVQAVRALLGIGDDEDDDLRWFVPPWQENSRFIYTSKPENATYRFVDLGYSDPHAYLTDATIAFMRGDNWHDGLLDAMEEFLRPFLSEEILAKTLMDVRGNADQKIFNPKDSAGEQAKDIIAYVWSKALEPGTISSLRRIVTAVKGTDPNLETKTEVLALTTGQRLQKVDVEHSLGFRIREFGNALSDIQGIARKTATSRGTASGEMVATDVARMEKLRLAEFSQMQRILGAARRLGVPEETIRDMLRGELPDNVAEELISGDYAPYEMTPQTVQQMLNANPSEFRERFAAWHGDRLPEAISKFASPRIFALPTSRPDDPAKSEQYEQKLRDTKKTLDALGLTREQAQQLLTDYYMERYGKLTESYNAKSVTLAELYE